MLVRPMLFSLLVIAVLAASLQAEPSFANVDRDQLRKTILPKQSESKWLSIPWEVSIWQARQKAAKEGKPILLWEMDGHPMGCT